MPDRFKQIGEGFDRLVFIYDHVVSLFFGQQIKQLEHQMLEQIPTKESCIIIGGGSGRVLRTALELNLAKTFYYVELSDKMIEATRKSLTLEQIECVRFSNSIPTNISPVDLIILPFVLDCYKESSIRTMLNKYQTLLISDGLIAFIDFNSEEQFQYDRLWWKDIFIRCLYLFFRLTTKIEANKLGPFHTLFQEEGFEAIASNFMSRGWLQSSIYRKVERL